MGGNTCPICDGNLESRTVRQVTNDEQPVVVVNAPADVCDRCHTPFFPAAVAAELLRLMRDRPAPARWIQVPV